MGFFDVKKGGNRVSRKNHKRAYGADIYKTWVRTGKLEKVFNFITECAKKLVTQTEMCKTLKMDPRTFSTLKKNHPDVQEAIDKAKFELKKDLASANLIEAIDKALDIPALDKQIETLTNELNDMNKEFELLVKMNTTTQQDQTIWRKKYAELEDIYKNKEAELNSLVEKKNEVKLKISKFNALIETLKEAELITDWDVAIFNFNLKKAIVHKDKSITFKFYSGFETTIKAEE